MTDSTEHPTERAAGPAADPVTEQVADLEIVHTPAEGTVLEGTRRGDGAIEALRAAGLRRWRWSRHVGEHGGWYLPGTRDRVPPFGVIDHSAAVLRAAGFTVAVDVDAQPRAMAETEADRGMRLDERTGRLTARAERHAAAARGRHDAADQIRDTIPPGQPILVGHHSEGRHRRALDRAENHERAGWEHDRLAALAAAGARTAAGHMGHREYPQVVAGRLERLGAERRRLQRQLDGHTRTFRRGDGSVYRVDEHPPAEGRSRKRLLVQAAHLDAQIRHWTALREAHRAAGRIDTVDWDQVHPGDLLQYRGRWEVVRRVNTTTVTVVVAPGWNNKILKRGVTAHRRPSHRTRPRRRPVRSVARLAPTGPRTPVTGRGSRRKAAGGRGPARTCCWARYPTRPPERSARPAGRACQGAPVADPSR
jgi:hypothetical protein